MNYSKKYSKKNPFLIEVLMPYIRLDQSLSLLQQVQHLNIILYEKKTNLPAKDFIFLPNDATGALKNGATEH